MELLRQLRLRHAAKRYAQKLPSQLLQSYGSSEFYTGPQIRAAAAKQSLSGKFIAFGHAAFMTKKAYEAIASATPVYLPYEDARALVLRFQPCSPASGSGNAEPSLPGLIS